MSLIVTIIEAFMAGLILFFLLPVFTRPLSWDRKRGILGFYEQLAMATLGRGVMVIRSNGGQMLKQTSYNARNGGEKTSIGGQTKNWRNPNNMMKMLASRPFGIVHEDKDVIYDIRTAHVAELFRDYKERGVWNVGGFRKAYANIPAGRQLVDPRPAVNAMQERATPGLSDRIDAFVEKMQSMFDSSNVMEYMPWLIALGAAFGMMWMASKMGGSSGGAVVPI